MVDPCVGGTPNGARGGTRAADAMDPERTVRVGLDTGPRTHATASAIPAASIAKKAPASGKHAGSFHGHQVVEGDLVGVATASHGRWRLSLWLSDATEANIAVVAHDGPRWSYCANRSSRDFSDGRVSTLMTKSSSPCLRPRPRSKR